MLEAVLTREVPNDVLRQARFLIVDDLPANVRLLESILRNAGYEQIRTTTDPRLTAQMFQDFQPDMLLLDINMPYMDGFDVMRLLKTQLEISGIPVIVLTADVAADTKHKALKKGARDFLTKPFDEYEVLLRINNLLETHFYSMLLEAKVKERTQELENAQMETLNRLALASDYRDDQTGCHARRVGRTSGLIAKAMGLPRTQIDLITQAASLHDVGKIGISDAILLKPGRYTPEEFSAMKAHTEIGAKILSGSTSPMLQLAEEIALYHHENWDGTGYAGISGADIPLAGRIVALADCFDALTHERPYKEAWPVKKAVALLANESGSKFDPRVVEAFLTLDHNDLMK